MKKKILRSSFLLLALILALAALGGFASAQAPPTPEEIEEAIVDGLAWLVTQQSVDGSWGSYSCDRVAYTGLAVLKLETRAIELGLDPLGSEYEYSAQTQAGLDYILANTHTQSIGVEPHGDPDGNGNGVGVYFNQSSCGYHTIYNSSIAMMAISASGHPELYGSTLQDAIDYMAWAQTDHDCGLHRGGWRYEADCSSDNSNAGYVTLGLGFAEAPPPFGFGLTVPQFVKDELSLWIDVIQDDVDGDTDDGGSWYDPYWDSYPWVNLLKTGNLIFEMRLVGDTPATPRFQDAMDYIERHWYDENVDPGWGYNQYPSDYQAMFILKKGLDFNNIHLLDLDGDGIPEHDWFMDFVPAILAQQSEYGYWSWCNWGDTLLCTTWALLAIEPFVPPSPVAIDIKPGSCPNPLNTKEKGVLPVAVVGLVDFDVSQIDPASVKLFRKSIVDPTMVYPLRWSYEDAAIPYFPFTGRLGAYDCLEYFSDEYGVFDGIPDLTFKFKSSEVIAAIGEVSDGDVITLILTGKLKEEYGGTSFTGEDVMLIIEK